MRSFPVDLSHVEARGFRVVDLYPDVDKGGAQKLNDAGQGRWCLDVSGRDPKSKRPKKEPSTVKFWAAKEPVWEMGNQVSFDGFYCMLWANDNGGGGAFSTDGVTIKPFVDSPGSSSSPASKKSGPSSG